MEGIREKAESGTAKDIVARRRYWNEQVERWRSSGLTQKEYCGKEGISLERFGAWKRRIDRKEQNGTLVAIPSRITFSALRTAALRLEVNDRYRIEIPDAFSPVTLETVLQVLNRL